MKPSTRSASIEEVFDVVSSSLNNKMSRQKGKRSRTEDGLRSLRVIEILSLRQEKDVSYE